MKFFFRDCIFILYNSIHKWAWSAGSWTMKKALEYFKMKVILEDKEAIEKSGPAIFALEPHDVLPLSVFAFNDQIKNLKLKEQ